MLLRFISLLFYSPKEMSNQYTVFRLPDKGCGLDKLKSYKEPMPELDKHQVVVRICAVSLNYRDIAIAEGTYPFPVKKSVVPCSDMCGVVHHAGSVVKSLKKGDKVISLFMQNALYGPCTDWYDGLGGPQDGVLQEYAVFPEHGLVKIPKESLMTDAEAASLVCTGVTSWNALYGNIPLKPGQTVLVLGTGGVSITALEIAKAAGAKTIVTSSSDAKLKHVQKTYKPTHVINYKKCRDWEKQVLDFTGGHGADYIIETGGAGTIEKSLQCVAYGGNISVIGFLAKCPPDQRPDMAALALGKGAVVRGIMVGNRQQLEEMVKFTVVNNIHMPVDKEFPFTDTGVMEAFQYMVQAGHVGKVCINFTRDLVPK
ncbi:putative zinc-type alcohol dehydrogenase-like protein [Umbelopsis sp. AD052]|nr:putative zinc-type alcohol dehydrogenase-like protein [Umbelopsis sp. AD052]